MLQMNLFAGQDRDADIENRAVGVIEGEEDGANWEIGIDIYILPCVKLIASGNLLYSTGNSVMI